MERCKAISVLIIEDNPGDARLVKEALAETGLPRFTLVWVSDLAQGLAHLSTNPVDAILLDLTLPDSRGYDTFDRLHAHAQQIPTILLTGLDDEALASQAMRHGAQDYLVKGKVDHELLARAIRYAIERKRAEERIQNLYAELQAIRNVNQLIVKEKDRGRLLEGACKILTQGRGYSNAWIALIGAEGKLQTAFEAGLGEALSPLVEKMHHGQFPACARRALNEPGSVIVSNPSSACEGCSLAHDFHERAAMATRLEYGGKVYGVVTVYLSATLIGEEEQSLFRELSVDLAFAMHTIEVGEEQSQAEEALRASEERYRMLAENMSDTVWLMDMNLNTTYISPSVTRLRGYSLEELNATPPDQQMPPDSLERAMQLFGEVLSPQNLTSRDLPISHRIDLELYKKDGSKFWCENTFTIIRAQNGTPVAILGSGRDITERKRVEDALRESEQRLRRFYESGIVSVFYWNMRGQITDANDKFLEMVGYTREELVSGQIDWANMTPPEFRHLDESSITELKAIGVNKAPFEKEYIRKNGTRIPILVAGAMLDEERFNGIAFVLDITERKQVEEERQTMIEFLRLANSSMGTVELIQAVTNFFQQETGCQAVGIRLRDGNDYPYYETRGFAKEFVQMENFLCSHTANGEVLWDSLGNPVLECMCGNVICGRFDPSKTFFTPKGSFWTNSTTQLLASTTEADRQARTRNRCNGEGYESVALIPLSFGDERMGLLQLNDPRKGLFTIERITQWERLADLLAIALARSLAKDALRESEERFRSLFENSTIGLYRTTPDGRVLMANPTLVHMLGLNDFNELAQRDLGQEGYEPDYPRSQFRQRLESENMVRGIESSWKRRDGSSIFVRESAKIARDNDGKTLYYEGTVEDITERKRAEDALRRSETFLTNIIEHSPHAMWISDEKGTLLRLNQACRELLHIKDDEVVGKYNVLQDNIVEEQGFLPLVKRVYEYGETAKFTIRYNSSQLENLELAQTTFVILDVTISSVLDANGKVTNAIIQHIDITDRERAGEEIRKLNAELEKRVAERTRELQEAQEKLVRQERLAVLGQLAGGVGHELRNPLGVIGNAVYFLRLIQPNADDKTQEYFGIIENETRTAEKIINDLLDYSRIKSVDNEPVEVTELFQRVLERYPAPAAVTVSVKIAARLPSVYADPRQMLQVLGNMVVNAYQAMPEGGELALSAKKKGDMVVISVQDTGAGIPPENMARLFEPLFTTKMHGIGLGLAVSRKLVEANGGRIEVQSELGKGSVFTVYTPVSKEVESTTTR